MMRWVRRIVLGIVGLVTLALIVGVGSESLIRQRVSTRFPVTGRLVDIGGRSLQIDCRGTGSPTVVLESGLDLLGALSWATVHDSLAATTRVCAYSRAGILWSAPSDQPFSVGGVVADLHLALARADEHAPFVLVAHSIGGLYATEFTRRFRAEVVGLVLVDASHPDQVARLEAATGVGMLPASRAISVAASLAGTGILRFLPATADPLTAPVVVHRIANAYRPVSIAALASEVASLPATFGGASTFRALGDLPFVVLTAGAPTPPATLQRMGMTEAQGERMRTEWIAMQEERSTWSSNGRHVLLTDASHYVQFDRPDAVVREVREVVRQASGERQQQRGASPPVSM